jgi:hypothetical protein
LRTERALKARFNAPMIAPSALMLFIDGLPWALPKAEDECCAFGAKHIRETPFPISKSGGLGSRRIRM